MGGGPSLLETDNSTMTTPRPFDKLDVEDVISKLKTSEKVALLTGLDMVRSIFLAGP